MTEKRFVRKGYKIWDTWEDEEVYELHYRYECRDICRILNNWSEENEQLKQQIKSLRLNVFESIREADEVQCSCNPCVVEECVKKVIE